MSLPPFYEYKTDYSILPFRRLPTIGIFPFFSFVKKNKGKERKDDLFGKTLLYYDPRRRR